jgi:tyrosinase
MATTAPARSTGAQATLHHRKNVERLSVGQLKSFRRALNETMELRDERGFQHHAGIHGLPLPYSCIHHQVSPLFLPWHRAYLYFLELALQDRVSSVSLPWWNWTSQLAHSEGLPRAYTKEAADGKDNPLHSMTIAPWTRQNDWPERTFRNPSNPGLLPGKQDVDFVLSLDDFSDFSTQLENLHDGVHVWVGGTMANIDFAAYDLIFWAHHAMIDRLWRLWQLKHPNQGPPRRLYPRALEPFGMTVEETLDVTTLGYDYAGSTARPRRNK